MPGREPNPERLTVVVVGTGAIGAVHARCVVSSPRMALVGLVNLGSSSAQALARQLDADFGTGPIAIFDSLDEAIRELSPDLVSVCTPPSSHLALSTTAINGGAHVLVEKPLALSLSDGRSFLRLAELAHGRELQIGVVSQHRFDDSSLMVRELLSDGALGTLISAEASVAWWRSQSYYDAASWRGTWAAEGGGALMNQAIHAVDLLLSFLGEPEEVMGIVSTSLHKGIEVEDNAVAAIRFRSGALASIRATTAAYPGVTAVVAINGTRGSATVSNDVLSYLHVAGESDEIDSFGLYGGENQAPDSGGTSQYVDPTRSTDGHARQYDDLLDAIEFVRQPSSNVDTAFLALATVIAVYLSASGNAPVEFAAITRGEFDDEDASGSPSYWQPSREGA